MWKYEVDVKEKIFAIRVLLLICVIVAAVFLYNQMGESNAPGYSEDKVKPIFQQNKSIAIKDPVFQYGGGTRSNKENNLPFTEWQQDATTPNKYDLDLLDMASSYINSESIKDLEAFLERLNEIKTTNIKEQELEQASTVFFSTIQPDIGIIHSDYKQIFAPESIRIYATFEFHQQPIQGKSSVLVKWHNSNKNILMFESVQINPNIKVNYIWKEMTYWPSGYYNIEIYDESEDFTLLATGSYEVRELNEYYSYLALYAEVNYGYSENTFTDRQKILLKLNYSSFVDSYIKYQISEIASNASIYEQDVPFPAAYKWQKEIFLNDYVSVIPPGTYRVSASDEKGNTVARTIFYVITN